MSEDMVHNAPPRRAKQPLSDAAPSGLALGWPRLLPVPPLATAYRRRCARLLTVLGCAFCLGCLCCWGWCAAEAFVQPSQAPLRHSRTALKAGKGFGAAGKATVAEDGEAKRAKPRGRAKKGCPCHSGRSYASCCEEYHSDFRNVMKPEALVRARYAAMAMGKDDFVMDTTHSSNPDFNSDREAWRREIRESQDGVSFMNLQLLKSKALGPDRHLVKLRATMEREGKAIVVTDTSLFLRENKAWYYANSEDVDTEIDE
eukprot:TRINITY_DN73527_c0_g1_i1.p1 TRINITY_DN73527_c0_g1~~TRINITY_DN73527_c0_g1_i1.p1  ORF type:complete len:279 (-),score=41.42 TRINITY_DN73527_c0_g1_i1:25-798(-)